MARTVSERRCARALWLLGLREPESVDEIRGAWKARVAQAHPDRRPGHPEAAHRLTAAFNDARDVCERWAASGRPWPSGRRVVSLWDVDEDEEETGDEPAAPAAPRRQPTADEARGERRSGLRPGDLVRLDGDPDADALERVASVTAAATTGPVVVELDDGRRLSAAEVTAAAYGCPICGHCEGPAVAFARRRPCPACLTDLHALERGPDTAEPVARRMAERARAGARRGDQLGDHGLGELGRERVRFFEALRRRPREQRRDALLAAFAHGFAVWGQAPVDAQAVGPEG